MELFGGFFRRCFRTPSLRIWGDEGGVREGLGTGGWVGRWVGGWVGAGYAGSA